MRNVVVDDHLLLRILLDDEPPELRIPGAQIVTTGLWYHRLARALGHRAVAGTLSPSLGSADPTVAASVIGAVTTLPDTVGLLSLRELACPMAWLLKEGVRLNLLRWKPLPPPNGWVRNCASPRRTRTLPSSPPLAIEACRPA